MNRRQVPYLVIALVIVTGLVIWLEAVPILRVPVVLGFLFLAPGMAFVPLLRLPQKGYELTLGIALSLLLEALFATVLVELRVWTLELNLELLGSLSVIGCGLQIWWPAPPEDDFENLEPDDLQEEHPNWGTA
jgi:hypothetical protein